MRARARSAITSGLLAAIALSVPASASPDLSDVDWPAERAAIARFQDHDQQLQDVGWAMVRGNAAFCDRVIPSVGLQLQDLASYGEPAIARAALGLVGDFAVQTAARGSPAAAAGEFFRNREVIALGQAEPNDWPAGERMDWQRLKRAHDHIDAVLAENGELRIAFADGDEARIAPVDACATRFELMGDGRKAVADGNRVVIGMEFPAFDYPEEVFAGVVAHELAHNLLHHSEWLDRNRRTRRHVRRTEREADRLMPWLLANAGYPPEAAVRFMETWGRKHDGGLFRARTHDGWDERAEFIAAEIPLIRSLMAREGEADWSAHFRREIDPEKGIETASANRR
jgi:hypothetical protein